MSHISSFCFVYLFLYYLRSLSRNLYFNPNCLPEVMIKAWLWDLHCKHHEAFNRSRWILNLASNDIYCFIFLSSLLHFGPNLLIFFSSSEKMGRCIRDHNFRPTLTVPSRSKLCFLLLRPYLWIKNPWISALCTFY